MMRLIVLTLALFWGGVALADNPHIKPVYDDNGRLVGYVDMSPEAHAAAMTFNYCLVTDPRPYPDCFRKPEGGGDD